MAVNASTQGGNERSKTEGKFLLIKIAFAVDKHDLMQNICRILHLTDISIMAVERDESRRE